MKRLDINEGIRPLSEFRANAANLIEQVRSTKRPLVITQHGKSSAVLLDVHEYQALLDKLELFEEIQIAESQIHSGLGIGHEKAKKQVLSQIREKE